MGKKKNDFEALPPPPPLFNPWVVPTAPPSPTTTPTYVPLAAILAWGIPEFVDHVDKD
jgi:hypothetical protein